MYNNICMQREISLQNPRKYISHYNTKATTTTNQKRKIMAVKLTHELAHKIIYMDFVQKPHNRK